ncbi:hypothetical protein [Listeria floridensis]|nr:hypothetical protein [Listeria floridensis]
MKKYREKNKEKIKIQGAKGSGKYFIRNHATLDDLEDFENLIEERKKSFKKGLTIYQY